MNGRVRQLELCGHPNAMKTLSVLAVDADAGSLAPLVALLQEAGYMVGGASTFEKAKQALYARRYDVLITEMKLGAYNGMHLVYHNRALNPEATAIVLAQAPNAASAIEAHRVGARYLERPADPQSLLAYIS
jgi:two-component system, NtrC family, response regulator HydG